MLLEKAHLLGVLLLLLGHLGPQSQTGPEGPLRLERAQAALPEMPIIHVVLSLVSCFSNSSHLAYLYHGRGRQAISVSICICLIVICLVGRHSRLVSSFLSRAHAPLGFLRTL